MSCWPVVDLEQIADISAGNPAPQGAEYFCLDGHPFVRMQDVGRKHIESALKETVDRVSQLAIRKCGLRLYPTGTVLIPKSGASVNLNHRAMLGCDAYVVSHLATVIPDQRLVLPSYLFHWSQHYDPRSYAQVTSLPSLPLSLIRAAKVPLPPLDEQQRIVNTLDQAAEIKRRSAAAIDKCKDITPALFAEMFGDAVRASAGWPVTTFSESIRVRSGNFLPAKAMDKDGRFPVYGGNGINGYHSEFMFDEPKIVIGRVGAYCGNVHISQPNSWITDNALYISEHRPDLTQSYLAMCLTSARLNERASQAGQPLISAGRLASVQIPVPPLSIQQEFLERVNSVSVMNSSLNSLNNKAGAMSASLTSQAFLNVS